MSDPIFKRWRSRADECLGNNLLFGTLLGLKGEPLTKADVGLSREQLLAKYKTVVTEPTGFARSNLVTGYLRGLGDIPLSRAEEHLTREQMIAAYEKELRREGFAP